MSSVVEAVFDIAFFTIMAFLLCGVFWDVIKELFGGPGV